jgi:hypothetical protein
MLVEAYAKFAQWLADNQPVPESVNISAVPPPRPRRLGQW